MGGTFLRGLLKHKRVSSHHWLCLTRSHSTVRSLGYPVIKSFPFLPATRKPQSIISINDITTYLMDVPTHTHTHTHTHAQDIMQSVYPFCIKTHTKQMCVLLIIPSVD